MLCLVVSKTQINNRLSRYSRRKSPSLWLNFPFKFSALGFLEYHFQRRPEGFAYHILQHLQQFFFFFFYQILIPFFLALVVKTSLRWTSRDKHPFWTYLDDVKGTFTKHRVTWHAGPSNCPSSQQPRVPHREGSGTQDLTTCPDSFSGSAGHILNKDRHASRGRSSTVGREVTFHIQTVILLPGSLWLFTLLCLLRENMANYQLQLKVDIIIRLQNY